ncbi:hypothetical protein BJ138DRAFT_1182675 [Hygrophoropsis aurantiaca]|uniref:Uncharacterized protein n=1 Tax=Hygrophoropsis aurantiaca TaxID=72124 RepID=A0ACB8A258_9AGAM|nr:hypothetical protein BJ138DRAFT_1182675 [Hygrophoropsis aurantiaca]
MTSLPPTTTPVPPATTTAPTPKKKAPYPFYLGGLAATIAASITHPLDLTKVRLQASGDKRMLASLQKTVRTAGVRGLFDGISGTWMRQMSYSVCRFWAYDESKKILGVGVPGVGAGGKGDEPWRLAVAGMMAGSVAGIVGNPGEVVMVRLQGDFAKPPEKRFNYKHCFDALFRRLARHNTMPAHPVRPPSACYILSRPQAKHTSSAIRVHALLLLPSKCTRPLPPSQCTRPLPPSKPRTLRSVSKRRQFLKALSRGCGSIHSPPSTRGPRSSWDTSSASAHAPELGGHPSSREIPQASIESGRFHGHPSSLADSTGIHGIVDINATSSVESAPSPLWLAGGIHVRGIRAASEGYTSSSVGWYTSCSPSKCSSACAASAATQSHAPPLPPSKRMRPLLPPSQVRYDLGLQESCGRLWDVSLVVGGVVAGGVVVEGVVAGGVVVEGVIAGVVVEGVVAKALGSHPTGIHRVGEILHPATRTPSSMESTPSSVESMPSSVESTPSSVESTPSPVESMPSSVESMPSSVESTPSSVESTPSSVESTPSSVVVSAEYARPSVAGSKTGSTLCKDGIHAGQRRDPRSAKTRWDDRNAKLGYTQVKAGIHAGQSWDERTGNIGTQDNDAAKIKKQNQDTGYDT